MESKLKPCPFCGCTIKTKVQEIAEIDSGIRFFYCENIECQALISFRQPTIDTQNHFNLRAKP